MVARGDLGVELSTEEVPTLQKRIIEMANARGQGRDHGHPDAGEHDRAPAAHPRRGLGRGQRDPGRHRRDHALRGDGLRPLPGGVGGDHGPHRAATPRSTAASAPPRASPAAPASDGGAQPGPRGAHGGGGAGLQADRGLHGVGLHRAARSRRYRPRAPIAAITYNEETYRRLALWWGVVPVKSEFARDHRRDDRAGEELLKRRGLVRPGRHHADAGRPEPHRRGHQHAAGPHDLVRRGAVVATVAGAGSVGWAPAYRPPVAVASHRLGRAARPLAPRPDRS